MNRRLLVSAVLGVMPFLMGGCCAGRCDVWSCATHNQNEYFSAEERADQRMAFRRLGQPGRRLTLVFLHGLAQNKFSWRDVAQQFDTDHQVLLVDLLGHGDSAKPNDSEARHYRMAAQGRRVARLIESERRAGRVDHVILVGLSYGGGTALEAARCLAGLDPGFEPADGDPVAGVVLAAPACYEWDYFHGPQFAEERVLLEWAVRLPWANAIAHQLVFEITILERAYWRQHRISEEARREIRHQYRSVASRVASARATLDMADELAERRGKPRYSGIGCPVLLLYGAFDAYVAESVMERLCTEQAGNERFTFKVLPDAGHALPGEKATEVIDELRAFLERYGGT